MPPSHVEFKGRRINVMLAPMEGVVDHILRDVLTKIGGIDLCVTEFIRVTDRLLPRHEILKYCPELDPAFARRDSTDNDFGGTPAKLGHTRSGTPVLVQFLGGQAEPIAENAVQAYEMGAVGIDLNFGCPAKTVNRHDGGASLLKNPHRLFDVLTAVKLALPAGAHVSAKVRLGFQDPSLRLEIAHAVNEAKASWLVVHGRTRDEGYKPIVHWDMIREMRDSISIPVIANGEIWNASDARKCLRVSDCHSLMTGRGLIARPSLAREIQSECFSDSTNAPANHSVVPLISWPELQPSLHDFLNQSESTRSAKYAVARMKQWMKQLSRTYPEAATKFEQIKTLENITDMRAQVF